MSTNGLVSLAGWYFLPGLVTGYVQTALYAIFIRAGDPKPTPGSPAFTKHRRYIQITVIVLYLLYTIYEADYQLLQEGDFYTLLGVPHNVEERTLQSKFRRLTVQYHPDKASLADKPAHEQIYIRLKLARDTLVDPAKRFAYDRFGADILAWQKASTIRDFVYAGLQQLGVYYIGSTTGLVLLSVLGYLKQGTYWRYFAVAALLLVELHTITRPTFPFALTHILNPLLVRTGFRNPYLPYQLITLLRKLTVTFFIAMSQLGPLLQDAQQTAQAAATDGSGGVNPKLLDRIDNVTAAADSEITRLMGLELMPFATDPGVARELRGTVKEWLVQNTVRNDPEVKGAVGRVLERRRRQEGEGQGQ
ncbi:hypothetical protein M409DRAFT_20540 [Zasmidium cellare ATCC 36951]|uniref:J domain-containing protein n=1 Tax=Zasmidium cellare ATCC 36951 TaxID=1080233 RepID=A0A6A6CQE7_ZASCE|nr:uncharacterized protein M409DRAFT_20540 [Zasmidium cellare ATCC 36951]KAF2169315.1 hypothetical protein M409DRAFT_20540 [Zasmidium cellare ATCC 36951]